VDAEGGPQLSYIAFWEKIYHSNRQQCIRSGGSSHRSGKGKNEQTGDKGFATFSGRDFGTTIFLNPDEAWEALKQVGRKK